MNRHLSELQQRTKSTTTVARAVRLWSFEQQNKQKKAGVSDLEYTADAPAIFSCPVLLKRSLSAFVGCMYNKVYI